MAARRYRNDGLFKRNGIWQIRTDPITGRCKSTGKRDKKAAEEFYRHRERLRVSPDYAAATKATFGEWREKMIAEKRRTKAEATVTFFTQKSGHYSRIWGDGLKLSDIGPALVDDYRQQREAEDASHYTLFHEFGALRNILRMAKRAGCYTGDLMTLFPLNYGTGYKPRETVLTVEHEAMMKCRLKPHQWAAVAFILATSARRGEMWRARREDWDAVDNVMYLRGTKTAGSARHVAVYQRNLHYMTDALEHMPFHWPGISQELPAYCERWGIQRYTPNDLRRTYATRLAERGLSGDWIRRDTGHSNTKMLDKVYDRSGIRERRAAAEKQMGKKS